MPRSSNGLGKDESVTKSVRMPKELAAKWTAYSKSRGETVTETHRAVIQFLVDQPGDLQEALDALVTKLIAARDQLQASRVDAEAPVTTETNPARVVTDRVEAGAKRRTELKLTASEREAVEEAAAARGCSVQHWITSMVRASLTQGHLFGVEEMQAFGESNYQLMAMGRNLNQITRQINADPDKNLHRLSAEAIDRLAKRLDDHRYQVHRALYACSHRWELARPS